MLCICRFAQLAATALEEQDMALAAAHAAFGATEALVQPMASARALDWLTMSQYAAESAAAAERAAASLGDSPGLGRQAAAAARAAMQLAEVRVLACICHSLATPRIVQWSIRPCDVSRVNKRARNILRAAHAMQ
jgi:hypothetical protein